MHLLSQMPLPLCGCRMWPWTLLLTPGLLSPLAIVLACLQPDTADIAINDWRAGGFAGLTPAKAVALLDCVARNRQWPHVPSMRRVGWLWGVGVGGCAGPVSLGSDWHCMCLPRCAWKQLGACIPWAAG